MEFDANFVLFKTDDCHLCEQAETLVDHVFFSEDLRFQQVNIATNPDWQIAYGIRVPVLLCTTTRAELGWPFDESQLRAFIFKN